MSDPRDPKDANGNVEYELDADAAESSAAAAPESPPEASSAAPPPSLEVPALTQQLARALVERDELRKSLIRLQADFANYRKRIERERFEDGQRAVARLIAELLPVLDAFERALAAHNDTAYEEYRKGFELIYRQLWETLTRLGLERIEAEGKRFDPHYHQAIERVESPDREDGTVLEVLQHGYKLREKVLRPAIVRVAVHPAEASPKPQRRANGVN